MAELTYFKQKRKSLKASLTRFHTFLASCNEHTDKESLVTRLEKIQPFLHEFEDTQTKIECLENSELDEGARGDFEETYFIVIARARNLIEAKTVVNRTNQNIEGNFSAESNVKLPTIDLPTFSGRYEDWLSFIDVFTAMIDSNDKIQAVQKLHYLRSCLRGEAANIIGSLETSANNYSIALQLIKDRYENSRVIIQNHVRALMDLPSVTSQSAIDLCQLIDGILKHIRSLKSLNVPTDQWDALLLHIVTSKLDRSSRFEWEKSQTGTSMPSLNDLWTFLRNRCHILETMTSDSNPKRIPVRDQRIRQVHLGTAQVTECPACKEQHNIQNCNKFFKQTYENKIETIKRNGLCFNCLRSGHTINACQSISHCKKCKRRHHTMIHPPANDQSKRVNDDATNQVLKAHVQDESRVMLSTVIVDIFDADGHAHPCRIILDAGSQANFLTERLCKQLKLNKNKVNIPVKGIGESISTFGHSVFAKIKSRINAFTLKLHWLVIPSIVNSLPASAICRDVLQIPNNMKLADPSFHLPREVDGLIGAEYFYELLSIGQIKLPNRETLLQKTKFGWIVAGKCNRNLNHVRYSYLAVGGLNELMERFWRIEEMPRTNMLSEEDEECEQHYVRTVQRHPSGRYEVTLPFNQRKQQLGNSYAVAVKRFTLLERKFSKNPEFFHRYREIIEEYKHLGHITEVPNYVEDGYFMPHHAIERSTSLTTNLRVVFDASAKTDAGLSLNDTLMVGPVIQDDLFVILLRFRNHRVVLAGDIEKMYRQISVNPEDRKYQRFLWREDSGQPIRIFELNTLAFGTSSAPFLATRTLLQLTRDEGNRFPNAATVLSRDVYVDDLLTGSNNVSNAKILLEELVKLTESGKFKLRKWASNSSEVLQHLGHHEEDPHLCVDLDKSQKMLGIHWRPSQDVLTYNVVLDNQVKRITKRIMLSQIASLYDPLGLVSPVIVKAKILMQRLWMLRTSWDESIPIEIATTWMKLRQQLLVFNRLSIPRYALVPEPANVQIHGFSDASEAAYGCCVYLRSTDLSGHAMSHLICSRTRVAPLKRVSLARLELCAAVTLADLISSISSAINVNCDKVTLWSDSMIVLHWINTPTYRLKTFIANRVAKIQEVRPKGEWRYVPSESNPADLASRGKMPAELENNEFWFHGPKWLTENEECWPRVPLKSMKIPEQRSLVSFKITQAPEIFKKYSSWKVLQRIISYCMRFVNNCKKGSDRCVGSLAADELKNAARVIVGSIQGECFAVEINCLQSQRPLPRSSKLLCLNSFIDTDLTLRVGGRLRNSNLSHNQTHPMILPEKHHVTDLILRDAHVSNCHAGKQTTLYNVRQQFWPINGKMRLRGIIRNCVVCARMSPKYLEYVMADLPKCRFNTTRPFANIGVDFCGPFFVKEKKFRNRNRIKIYVSVFICLASKAVHLEVVSDLTTDAFIAALKRFFSRRGRSRLIYSDNATNFVGANNELRELYELFNSSDHRQRLTHYTTDQGVQWKFIPPRSPHFGGIWEAAVKSFKFHLIRAARGALLTFENFNTLVIEIEAILNSRPLTPLSDDPNDISALTPSHFLIGDSLLSVPENDLSSISTNRLTAWRHVQKIKRDFWIRWRKEYLNEINQRTKWTRSSDETLKLGSLVLLKEDSVAPLHWPLARIIELHPGKDGIVRVITVRTAKGIYTRSCKGVALLPIGIS